MHRILVVAATTKHCHLFYLMSLTLHYFTYFNYILTEILECGEAWSSRSVGQKARDPNDRLYRGINS